MREQLVISDEADDPVAVSVIEGLARFNETKVGNSDRTALIVKLIGDGGDALPAGLVAYTAWGWLCIEKLWIATDLRGDGRAGKLLAAAEKEAVRRGCKGAWLDTFNPDAKRLYERLGYEVFGLLPEFVATQGRYFMTKQLTP